MSDLKRLQRRFPVFFVSLVGGDYQLLLKSGPAVVRKYFLASVFLLAIMLVSAVSVFYATDLLFHFWQAEVVLALFITGLFLCIYIFLITTFSKHTKQERVLNASNVVRMGFVLFMAFLISKPIEVLVFSKQLDAKVTAYKISLHASYERSLDRLIFSEKEDIQTDIDAIQQRLTIYPIKSDHENLATLVKMLSDINSKKQQNLQRADKRIEKSDFLLFRVQQVVRQPLAWVICIGITLLFFLPGYLIYSIPATESYYDLKEEMERKMIMDEYNRFTDQYKNIFKEKWGIGVELFSRFEDPPFNKVRRKDSERLTTDDFIKRYLGRHEF